METSGIGAPKKQEVNVKDIGSVTPQLVVKGKRLKGSRKGECGRKHLSQREWKRKARDRKKMKMRREGNTSDLQLLLLLRTMRLTTPPTLVIVTNENGGRKVIG